MKPLAEPLAINEWIHAPMQAALFILELPSRS
jgi:hypothetical protein